MPISFTVFEEQNYYESTYTDAIDDDTLLASYREFYESGDWYPSLNELVDLSQCDLSAITSQGIIRIQRYVENHLIKHKVPSMKTAFFAPKMFAYGLSNIYAAFAVDSSELTGQFKDKAEAERWLLGEVAH